MAEESQQRQEEQPEQLNVEIMVRMTLNTKAAVLRACREHQEALRGEVARLTELLIQTDEPRPLISGRLEISRLELEELQRGISQLWHARNHKGRLR